MTPPTDAERIRRDGERAARRKDPELRAWGETLLAGLVAAGMPAGPVARRRKELREMVRRGR